jgi:hypothetical protein
MFSCPGLSRLGRVVPVFSNLSPSINSNVSLFKREREGEQQKKSDPHKFNLILRFFFSVVGVVLDMYGGGGAIDSFV